MLPNRLLRSSTFRYALAYLALFGLSVCGLFAFIYWSTISVIEAQSDATIEAEITGLAAQYRERGVLGLAETIRGRSTGTSGQRGIYLLADSLYTPLAGNLTQWPEEARGDPGWADFRIRDARNPQALPQVARARSFRLGGGFQLLVGRDLTERVEFRENMINAFVTAIGITLLLGLAGGIITSRNFLRRIDAINASSRAILNGDLKQRMPITGRDDEFDRLAQNLNEMLDQISRLMDGMRGVADNIAHDLRSPISRLRSRLEVTLMRENDPDRYREAIEQTIEEADIILRTFNALLAIALAESGALKEEFRPVDLAAVARGVAELYQAAAEDRGLKFDLSASGPCRVSGHEDLLTQAISNLLDNALNHTPADGTVTLTVHHGDGPEVIVADTGPGIPQEARQKVLERFVRLDSSRSAPGSGLGLSQVAATAHLHGAHLMLEDNAPGLRVRLEFPLLPIE